MSRTRNGNRYIDGRLYMLGGRVWGQREGNRQRAHDEAQALRRSWESVRVIQLEKPYVFPAESEFAGEEWGGDFMLYVFGRKED